MAHTLYELGLWVRQAERLEEASEMFRRCLAIEEAELGADDMQVTYTIQELVACLRTLGRWKEAGELLTRCLSIQRAKLGPNDVCVADTLL